MIVGCYFYLFLRGFPVFFYFFPVRQATVACFASPIQYHFHLLPRLFSTSHEIHGRRQQYNRIADPRSFLDIKCNTSRGTLVLAAVAHRGKNPNWFVPPSLTFVCETTNHSKPNYIKYLLVTTSLLYSPFLLITLHLISFNITNLSVISTLPKRK